MNALKQFLMNKGLNVMMVGFLIFFGSFITFVMAGHYGNPSLRTLAMVGAVLGFAVYTVGRIAVFVHNKKKKRQANNLEQIQS